MSTTDLHPDSASLAAWLRAQPIALRTRAALLRDLDRADAGPGDASQASQLSGLDPQSFTRELHTADGGRVARVPGISARALAGLRRALPLPALAQPGPSSAAETPAPPEAAPDAAHIEQPPAAEPPAPPDGLDATLAGAPESTAENTVAALARAADGLLVPSETDSPFTAFWVDDPAPAALLARLGLPPSTPVETRALDEFFAPLTRVADWMDEAQRAQAARFAELRNQIEALLQGVTVYRFGRVQITVLIVGQTAGGESAGLSTILVET